MTEQNLDIQIVPAQIRIDADAARREIEAELKRFDVIVTPDSVAEAKKMATELNKRAEALNRRRIDVMREVKAPLDEADAEIKSIIALYKEGRARLLSQTEEFDRRRLEEARDWLETFREQFWNDFQVSDEYRRAEFGDLIKLSALTAKGNLTASARRDLEKRVRADKERQDQTERRLLELENASYRAGLGAPLSRDHVRPFLFMPEEAYQAELKRILEAELRREKIAAERRRVRDEIDNPEPPPSEPEKTPEPEIQADPNPLPDPPPEKRADGKVTWRVSVSFELEAEDRFDALEICRGAIKRMKSAGMASMTEIRAVGSNQDAARMGRDQIQGGDHD